MRLHENQQLFADAIEAAARPVQDGGLGIKSKKVMSIIQVSLNNDLPESYDREVFNSKTNLLMNHFIDMAVQGYGWLTA